MGYSKTRSGEMGYFLIFCSY